MSISSVGPLAMLILPKRRHAFLTANAGRSVLRGRVVYAERDDNPWDLSVREPWRDFAGEPFVDEQRGVSSDAEVVCRQRQPPTVGLIGEPTNPPQTSRVAVPGDEGVTNEADTHVTTDNRHDFSLGSRRNSHSHIPCGTVGNAHTGDSANRMDYR